MDQELPKTTPLRYSTRLISSTLQGQPPSSQMRRQHSGTGEEQGTSGVMSSSPVIMAPSMMPASAFGSMNMAQRFRDAHLARALVDAAEANGAAFLLAGNGHVRTDRGVPWYVRRMAPQRQVLVVTLLEAQPGENDAASYLPRAPDGKVASDYALFTPRTERPDPCQQMREQVSKKK